MVRTNGLVKSQELLTKGVFDPRAEQLMSSSVENIHCENHTSATDNNGLHELLSDR